MSTRKTPLPPCLCGEEPKLFKVQFSKDRWCIECQKNAGDEWIHHLVRVYAFGIKTAEARWRRLVDGRQKL